MKKIIVENFICKHCGCEKYTHIFTNRITVICDYCGEEYEGEFAIEKIEETKIEDTWNPENIDVKYIRAKAYIIMEYEDEKKYFYIKELLQELKEKFKVTKKEFLEIILPQLEKEKRILTQYYIGSNSKTIRYNKADGFRCRITKFAITNK